ncbi:hepcidin-like [Thunnus thynnus]|uniref:hepcidin-like n=1 Tax=Thunnus thynnus TaxID=8237 RepID=UPI003529CD06
MKTFSIAVAVAVVLTFICIQENSAVPVVEVQGMEVMISDDAPLAADSEAALALLEVLRRQKRGLYCGRCCDNGVCRKCCYA